MNGLRTTLRSFFPPASPARGLNDPTIWLHGATPFKPNYERDIVTYEIMWVCHVSCVLRLSVHPVKLVEIDILRLFLSWSNCEFAEWIQN